ncbi:MAG: tyrosine-type recombinase/integrase [Bdellovibrionales bacterium]|jgi:integrase|nr:tyrosine-type recombinase/integrase [Bdellovibrionales bacterium]
MTTKARYSDLVRLDKHPHYYVNPLSKKITYRRTHRGETITIRTGETSISRAKEIVETELERRRTGQSEDVVRRRRRGVVNPRLEDVWLNELLPMKIVGKELSTQRSYVKSWKHGFGDFLKEVHCSDMNEAKIAKFKKWYLDEKPKRDFTKTFIHLKMLLKFIVQRGYLSKMPDLSELEDVQSIVEKNAKRPKVGRVYTKEQVEALLSVHTKFDDDVTATRVALGIRLGLRGLRKMEAMKLRREKVNFTDMVLEIWSQKNSEWRQVPITTDVAELFKRQFALNPNSDWVFPMATNSDRHISGQLFDKAWFQARTQAGIKPRHRGDARFHDLRHTFATWTAEQGWPARVACDVLDMSLRVYETVYSHPRLHSKTEWMNKTFPSAGGAV